GRALLPPMAPPHPAAAQAHHLQTPQNEANPIAEQRRLGAMLQQDGKEDVPKIVAEQASVKFNDVMGKNRFDNFWRLQRVESTEQWFLNDGHTQLVVKLHFTNGVFNDSYKGYVTLYFNKSETIGSHEYWKFSSVGYVECNNFVEREGDPKLSDRVKEVYTN